MTIYIPTTESGYALYCFDSCRSLLDLNTPEAIYAVATDVFGEDIRKNGLINNYKNGYNSSYAMDEHYWPISVKAIAEKKRFADYVMEYLFKYGVRVFDGFIISAAREKEFLMLKPEKKNTQMKSISISVSQPRVAKVGSITLSYVAWYGVSRAADGYSYIDSSIGLHIQTKKSFERKSKLVFAKDSVTVISKYNKDAKNCLAVIEPECAIEVKVTRPEYMWGTLDEIDSQIINIIREHLEDEGYITSKQSPTDKMK